MFTKLNYEFDGVLIDISNKKNYIYNIFIDLYTIKTKILT